MQKNEYGFRKINWWLAVIILLTVLAAGYYLAAGMEPGFLIYDWLDKMQKVVLKEPLQNYWNVYSLPCMIFAFICYLIIGLYYLASAKNYMRGREYGTARFIDASRLNKELANLSEDVWDEKNIVLRVERRWLKKIYHIERM